MALSGVRRPLSVVRHVSSVSTITTRNNQVIKSIFGAIVHHVPGLCLLGIRGAPFISHKIMAQKPNFYIFDFEIIAKDNLNIENLMQTFENLLLQNYPTKFLDIAHKLSLVMCNSSLFKWWRRLF